MLDQETVDELRALEPNAALERILELDPDERIGLSRDWRFVGRPEQQLPVTPLFPDGGWAYWLYMAGRGAGKTRTGGETVREWVKQGVMRIGLIAPTAGDARDVMVEGESGVLACCFDEDFTHPVPVRDEDGNLTFDEAGKVITEAVNIGKPIYEPSKRRLTWANGAKATLYSADEPDRLRGPQHEKIWADELCAWRYPETWDLAMFGLRLGTLPQAFISTTPKPKKLIIDLLKDKATVVTRGSTYSNRANLADLFFKQVVAKYEGTRLGRQELDGELLEESENALWSRDMLDGTRRPASVLEHPDLWLKRIVVAIDPATTHDKESDETGIVVCALGSDNNGYVLADYSGRYSPAQWAKKAKMAYRLWQADRIIAEGNQGGEMVTHTIQSVADPGEYLPVTIVHASKGKAARAEPIAALFEQNKAHIVGREMRELEDQLCVWEPLSGDASPDRLDAMVWGLTECCIGYSDTGEAKVGGFY